MSTLDGYCMRLSGKEKSSRYPLALAAIFQPRCLVATTLEYAKPDSCLVVGDYVVPAQLDIARWYFQPLSKDRCVSDSSAANRPTPQIGLISGLTTWCDLS
jgi:hypothetical protein